MTGNKDLFKTLVGLGAELVSLHLMESPRLDNFITRFPVSGSQVVAGVRYEDSKGRVYINSEQYVEGVPPESVGLHHRRLSGLQQMAQGPQGPDPQL